jgi:hypothetical protein
VKAFAISDVVPFFAWITAVQPAILTSGTRSAHRDELSSPFCVAAEHVSTALMNMKNSHRLGRILYPLLSEARIIWRWEDHKKGMCLVG